MILKILAVAVVAVMLTNTAVFCQHKPGNKNDLITSFFSSRNEYDFLMPALDSSVCIIRQEYDLIDSTGKEFGADGKPYWGINYALGIITDSGIYALTEIFTPWANDADLVDFMKTDAKHLQPHISKRLYRRLNTTAFANLAGQDTIKNSNGLVKPQITNDSLFAVLPAVDLAPSLSLNLSTIDTAGILLLVSSRQGKETTDTAQLTYKLVKPSAMMRGATSKLNISFMVTENEKILGGAYFNAKFSLGKISFLAAGLLAHDSSGWYVNPFCGNSLEKKSKPGLTPIPVVKGS